MEQGHSDVTAPDDATNQRRHMPRACEAVNSVLSRVGDKWSVLIVMMLADGPRRFNELKREIGVVSQRMLTLTLRGLERDGLVTRTMYATIPPRVEYELTALGHSLRVPIQALGKWAFANLPAIQTARDTFDAKAEDKERDESAFALFRSTLSRPFTGVSGEIATRRAASEEAASEEAAKSASGV